MKFGYARVSTRNQNLDRQLVALRAAGCDKIFAEKQSGANTQNRPELQKAITALGVDDVLVLAEWDRATRSMADGIRIMERIHERRALIKVIDRPWLDLTTPIGKGILAFLSSLAEDERERINRRASEGRAEARRNGVRFGRKPMLNSHQRREVLRMIEEGRSTKAIARTFDVGVATIQRVKERA